MLEIILEGYPTKKENIQKGTLIRFYLSSKLVEAKLTPNCPRH